MEHIFEKIRLSPSRSVMHGEPEEAEGIAHRQFPSKVQVLELPARVVDVVQDANGAKVLPFQGAKVFASRVLTGVEGQGRRAVSNLVQDPVAHPHQGLGLVHGFAHDLFEVGVFAQEALEQAVGFYRNGDAVELGNG